MLNPLFPSDDSGNDVRQDGVDPFRPAQSHNKRIEPLQRADPEPNPAADLIRQKIQTLYADEPNAKQEIKEVTHDERPLSKHQQYMLSLSKSGKSLAEIQHAWHSYYAGLPDNEKHEVWREFYSNSRKTRTQSPVAATQQPPAQQPVKPQPQPSASPQPVPNRQATNPNRPVFADHYPSAPASRPKDIRTTSAIKRQIVGRADTAGKLKLKHHVQSLAFGLGVGIVVVFITLFSFFNQEIIAPFIQPSRQASATPLIIGSGSVSPTATPEVIIPKINVEIPLNFSVSTTNEDQIENALEDGVVHYPTTVLPGQKGNTAFFGHSSNNIFNPGHYKFAFALLHDLVPGDTFYLTYSGKVYAYQVFQRQIVDPSDVSVLDNVPGKIATAALITCDPPGTSLHRLVVWGEQVSPNPSDNTAGSNTSTSISNSTQLPSNGPSLWSRLTSWL